MYFGIRIQLTKKLNIFLPRVYNLWKGFLCLYYLEYKKMEQKKEESKGKMENENEQKNETNQPENIKYSIKIGDVNYEQSLELAEKYK